MAPISRTHSNDTVNESGGNSRPTALSASDFLVVAPVADIA